MSIQSGNINISNKIRINYLLPTARQDFSDNKSRNKSLSESKISHIK